MDRKWFKYELDLINFLDFNILDTNGNSHFIIIDNNGNQVGFFQVFKFFSRGKVREFCHMQIENDNLQFYNQRDLTKNAGSHYSFTVLEKDNSSSFLNIDLGDKKRICFNDSNGYLTAAIDEEQLYISIPTVFDGYKAYEETKVCFNEECSQYCYSVVYRQTCGDVISSSYANIKFVDYGKKDEVVIESEICNGGCCDLNGKPIITDKDSVWDVVSRSNTGLDMFSNLKSRFDNLIPGCDIFGKILCDDNKNELLNSILNNSISTKAYEKVK